MGWNHTHFRGFSMNPSVSMKKHLKTERRLVGRNQENDIRNMPTKRNKPTKISKHKQGYKKRKGK